MQETAVKEAIAKDKAAPGGRILIVDDNSDIVRVMQRVLGNEGYQIQTAADGEQALKLARQSPPDLILLDVMIPRLDGMQVCRQLKKEPPTSSTMVILVTGRGSQEHLVQGFEAGADDYIPKPFHIPELLARTRSALRIKHLTDDLAERNRLLERHQRQLVQKEKMATIGLLASGIAHEFNNIMGGICSYAQLARKDPKYKDILVDVAMTQTERAFELTRSLSTYNRAAIDEAHCCVKKVIESVLCLVAKRIQKAGVKVVTEVDSTLYARISPGQLQEVILNLLINAIDAIDHREGEITVRARTADNPTALLLEVRDNGGGIPEQDLGKIFDPFFTTKGALGGGSTRGTGLGLTVCYNVVHANSGQIEVESKLGEGTVFRIELPRSLSSVYPPRRPAEPLAPPARPLRILVIGSEEPARDALCSFLRGQEVVCCTSAEDAPAAHVEKAFDYVIFDVDTQDAASSLQVFDRLLSLEPRPKVIFATGRIPDAVHQDCIRRAHGHLLKPYKLEDLARLLSLPPHQIRAGGDSAP